MENNYSDKSLNTCIKTLLWYLILFVSDSVYKPVNVSTGTSSVMGLPLIIMILASLLGVETGEPSDVVLDGNRDMVENVKVLKIHKHSMER